MTQNQLELKKKINTNLYNSNYLTTFASSLPFYTSTESSFWYSLARLNNAWLNNAAFVLRLVIWLMVVIVVIVAIADSDTDSLLLSLTNVSWKWFYIAFRVIYIFLEWRERKMREKREKKAQITITSAWNGIQWNMYRCVVYINLCMHMLYINAGLTRGWLGDS